VTTNAERKPAVRINDLARELEIKSGTLLDALPIVGVSEAKTHSSSISLAEADKVREYFQPRKKERAGAAAPSSTASRSAIDLSRTLKAIIEARQKKLVSQTEPSRTRLTPGQPIYRRSTSSPTAASVTGGLPTLQSARRQIEPQLSTGAPGGVGATTNVEHKSAIRINDLARELEIKSRTLLDALSIMGVAEGKTHSGSISRAEADKIRQYFQPRKKERAGAAVPSSTVARSAIDVSRISKPSDVLRAIIEARQKKLVSQTEPSRTRLIPGQPIYRRSLSSPTAVSATAELPTLKKSPRLIKPELGARPIHKVSETVVKGISAEAPSKQKTAYASAMEEAEQALKAMRMQEKNSRRKDDFDT
jgi:hypothetical protein